MKTLYQIGLSFMVVALVGCQNKTSETNQVETAIAKKALTLNDFKKIKGVENVQDVPFQLTSQLDSIRFFVSPHQDSARLKIAYNKLDNFYGFDEYDDFYSIHYSINNTVSNSIEAFVLKSEFTAAFDLTLEGVDLYEIRSSLFKGNPDLKTKSFQKYGAITEVSEREFIAASKNPIQELLVKNPLIKLKEGDWIWAENANEIVITQKDNVSTEDGLLSNEYIGRSPYLHLEVFKESSVDVSDVYYSFYEVKGTANFKTYTAGYPQIIPAQNWISYIVSNDDVGSDFEVGKYLVQNHNQESLLHVNFTKFKIADETKAFWADNTTFYAEVYPLNSAPSHGKKQKSAFIKIQLKANLF